LVSLNKLMQWKLEALCNEVTHVLGMRRLVVDAMLSSGRGSKHTILTAVHTETVLQRVGRHFITEINLVT